MFLNLIFRHEFLHFIDFCLYIVIFLWVYMLRIFETVFNNSNKSVNAVMIVIIYCRWNTCICLIYIIYAYWNILIITLQMYIFDRHCKLCLNDFKQLLRGEYGQIYKTLSSYIWNNNNDLRVLIIKQTTYNHFLM